MGCMESSEIKKRYIEFFKKKGHKEIHSASLIPEHDPSVLFTTAGMQPLVPYLLGQKHPLGKRLVNSQKCLRTDDIEEVGDESHLTFFEMLGNWSLGDYWKEDAIKFSFEFYTKILGMDKEKLCFTCFKGDRNSGKDKESYEIYKKLGIKDDKIFFLGKENWWGPVGEEGPCGPCSEIFYDTGKRKCSEDCNPSCNCGKYIEIGNNVFMEFDKENNKYLELKQKNVDFGGGLERIAMVLQKKESVFETDLFKDIVKEIGKKVKKKDVREKEIRIIADHLRAAVFILSENVRPSNVEQGYVLRRLIRRVMRLIKFLEGGSILDIAKVVIDRYKKEFKELERGFILDYLKDEKEKFEKTLERGLGYFEREIGKQGKVLDKNFVFTLFASYGFPIEMTKDLAEERKKKVNEDDFWKEYRKHQEISRKGASKKFKGGLGDMSDEVIKYHTVTHLLLLALREVLGKVNQRGSNLTKERLRFDFSFDRKLTDEELKKVENKVNEYIKKGLKIECEEMSLEEAKKKTKGMFEHKYGEKVMVYTIGKSVEICGGPHVENTRELGRFKIVKEESISAGVRRIKAVLD